MTSQSTVPASCHSATARHLVLSLWLAGIALSAQGQQVFKITGSDGKVTFSDKPPPNAPATVAGSVGNTGASAAPALPFELQQVVSKYPVTLYTTTNCGPCESGRRLLLQRGVPHAEKTVVTNDDLAAFSRISKEGGLPLLTIGGQQIKGFADTEWSAYLDAAGYPKQSALPATYRPAAPAPLSPLKIAPASAAAATGAAEEPAPAPRKRPTPPPSTDRNTNPAGIRF